MLPDLIRRDREPRVGITVHRATITLRVSAAGPDEPTCHQLMEPTLNTIRECLGGLVFGEEDDELEHAVIRLLQQRQQTLAVCEWGTRGLVARWLGAVDTTDRLPAALVVAGIASLEKLLGVSLPDGDRDRFVRAVAERLRDRCQTDLAIVTGPVPDPTADRPQITLALATPGQSFAVRRAYRGHPDVVLERAAKQALDLLRHYLTSGTCA
jgi:nicotinamide-nucleotide amidase